MNKYLIVIFIIIILTVLFFSQQLFFQKKEGYVQSKLANFWEDLKPKREVFFNNTKIFFQKQIFERITGEIKMRKEIVKEELEKRKKHAKEEIKKKIEEKENEIKESFWQEFKSFFQEKF